MFILDYVIHRIVAVILEMFWDKIVLGSRLYNTRGYRESWRYIPHFLPVHSYNYTSVYVKRQNIMKWVLKIKVHLKLELFISCFTNFLISDDISHKRLLSHCSKIPRFWMFTSGFYFLMLIKIPQKINKPQRPSLSR